MYLINVIKAMKTNASDKITGYHNKLGLILYNQTTKEYLIYKNEVDEKWI